MTKLTIKTITKSPIALILIGIAVMGLYTFFSPSAEIPMCGDATGCAVKLTGNQIQPLSYSIQPTTASLIPFKTAMVYDSRDNTWSSIVVNQNSIKVSSQTLANPQYTLYPTAQQLRDFEMTISRVNSGKQTTMDRFSLMMMWFQMKKNKYGDNQ